MKGAKQREWEPAISFTWCEALRKWKSPALPTFPRTAARRGIVFFEWAFVPDMARHWRANSCPDIKAPIMGYPESRLPTAEHRAPNPQFRQGVWKWGANKDLTSAHLSLAWFFGGNYGEYRGSHMSRALTNPWRRCRTKECPDSQLIELNEGQLGADAWLFLGHRAHGIPIVWLQLNFKNSSASEFSPLNASTSFLTSSECV